MVLMDEIILIALVAAALWTVMARSLLRAALGLALTSAVLSMIMFRLNNPWAAVFELSVCAGLISALFFCVVTITEPLTPEKVRDEANEKFDRFRYLPLLALAVWAFLRFINVDLGIGSSVAGENADVRHILWANRQLDLVGQIIILLCGVFGIVILLKEMRKKRG